MSEKNREIVRSKEEEVLPKGWVKCPFCPCFFATEEDFKLHMKAFGKDKETHFRDYLNKNKFPSNYYSREQRESWEKTSKGGARVNLFHK